MALSYGRSLFVAFAMALSVGLCNVAGATEIRIVVLPEIAVIPAPPDVQKLLYAPTKRSETADARALRYAALNSLTGHYTPFMPASAYERSLRVADVPERYDKGRARQA